MKKFIADPSFWALFPDAAIGVLTVKDINEAARLAPEQAAEVEALLKNANAAALAHLDEGRRCPRTGLWPCGGRRIRNFPPRKGSAAPLRRC